MSALQVEMQKMQEMLTGANGMRKKNNGWLPGSNYAHSSFPTIWHYETIWQFEQL